MRTEASEQLSSMKHYVQENLKRCCVELQNWYDTGVLTGNYVKTALSFLTDACFDNHKLIHVENEIKRSAIQFVVNCDELR